MEEIEYEEVDNSINFYFFEKVTSLIPSYSLPSSSFSSSSFFYSFFVPISTNSTSMFSRILSLSPLPLLSLSLALSPYLSLSLFSILPSLLLLASRSYHFFSTSTIPLAPLLFAIARSPFNTFILSLSQLQSPASAPPTSLDSETL